LAPAGHAYQQPDARASIAARLPGAGRTPPAHSR
jgi:hypothetical protein